jgi:predicted nucleotidyltransferase/DNA-binding XRE family transcriptional regulator
MRWSRGCLSDPGPVRGSWPRRPTGSRGPRGGPRRRRPARSGRSAAQNGLRQVNRGVCGGPAERGTLAFPGQRLLGLCLFVYSALMISTEMGDRLRRARDVAGLSQIDLGRLAGIPQSAISRYENGTKTPTLPVVERLFEAAGFEVALTVRPASRRTACFTGPVGRRVQPRRAALRALLVAAGATSPRVFGSVSRGDDAEDSDLDIVVDLPDDLGLVGWAGLTREASEVAGVEVDLVPREGLAADVARAIAVDGVAL